MASVSVPLLTEHQVAYDSDFAHRVRAAVRRVAREILREASDVPGHPFRIQLATRSLSPQAETDPGYGPAAACAPDVLAAAAAAVGAGATTPTEIQAAIGDDLILQAVRDMWNPLCGWAS